MSTTPLPPIADQTRLAALYEVSRVLGSSLNLDQALTIAVDAAIQLTHAERGFLMLFESEGGELSFRAARDSRQENLSEADFEVSRSVLREVAQSGTPVVTTNAQKDPRFARQDSVVNFALRSIMAVPLKVRGQIIGALYVDNKAREGLFLQDDLSLLHTFAGQAAIAIENARLYTQTDQALAARVAELQTMQTIDRQLNSSLEFEKVMAMTLEWAARYTAARTGWIGVMEETEAGPVVRIVAKQGAGGTRPLSASQSIGSTRPLNDPIISAAVEARTVQRLAPDQTGDGQARLIAPVVVHERRVNAVIVVERPNHAFSTTSAEFVARLADHAAVSIENARLYAALKRANDSKSEFVRTVSHELKLPMTSIKGYTDLVLFGVAGPLTDQQKQFLAIIRNNVERMAVLVSDLSDISRIEAGRVKIDLRGVDIADAVQETENALKAAMDGKHQRLALNLPADLPRARTDPSRLIQVLTNLISNAHKYSAAGAVITISAEVEPPRLRIHVQDNGYGISTADQGKLFTPFFRSEEPNIRQEPGWGLGLHLTKKLVEVLGGEISVQSTPGQGSTFSFTLPIDH
jgi:signal transduction histidine kinase